ncbi:MAG: hypothetical protein ACOCWW_01240 [Bacteroidota bacterium]
MIDEKYKKIANLLEDIWLHIDWESVDKNRRRSIWSEFENQIRGLSRCYSTLEPFLDRVCRRFNSYLLRHQTKKILQEDKDEEYLDVLREETQIPIMLLRLKREEARREF